MSAGTASQNNVVPSNENLAQAFLELRQKALEAGQSFSDQELAGVILFVEVAIFQGSPALAQWVLYGETNILTKFGKDILLEPMTDWVHVQRQSLGLSYNSDYPAHKLTFQKLSTALLLVWSTGLMQKLLRQLKHG